MIYTIYKATNTFNGKSYIGFDSSWPKRMNNHKGRHTDNGTVFYQAICKYGWDAFEWSILYQSKDKEHTKNIMEEQFIREYQSHVNEGHGYNMTYGGDGVSGQSDEVKYKQGSANRGKKLGHLSDETKRKIGLANSQKIRTEAEKEHLRQLNLGKKHSVETLEKMSKALKGRPSNPKAVEALINKISLDWIVITPDGQQLEVRNLSAFCNENNLNYKKMHAVGKGLYTHHKGYKVSKSA